MLIFVFLVMRFNGFPCTLANGNIYPLEEMLRCLRQVPYNATSREIRALIPTLKAYFENNPFVDYFRSPPPGYEKYAFDFVAEIDKIEATTFPDGFEFYKSLAVLFNKFKDGHVKFYPPCLSNYYYYLPFEFVVLNGKADDNFLTPYFYVSDTYVSSVTAQHLLRANAIDIRYSQIVAIDFDGGNNFTDIAKAISDWAVKYSNLAYNTHANWNEVTTHGFAGRNVAFFPQPASSSVTLLIIPEGAGEGSTPVSVKVPWYGLYRGSDEPTTLDQLCPPRPGFGRDLDRSLDRLDLDTIRNRTATTTNTTTTAADAGREAEGEAGEGAGMNKVEGKRSDKKRVSREMLKELRERVRHGKDEDVTFRNNRDALDYLKKSIPTAHESNPDFRPFDMARLRRIHHTRTHHTSTGTSTGTGTSATSSQAEEGMQGKAPAPAHVPAWTQTQTQTQSQTDPQLNPHEVVRPEANRLRNTKVRKRERSFMELRNDDTIRVLSEDYYGGYYMYIVPERRIGIVRIPTLIPTYTIDVFMEMFERMSTMDIDDVIIDVRGNTGGRVNFMEGLMFYLFPSLRPVAQESSWVKTKFMDDFQIEYNTDVSDPNHDIYSEWNSTTRVDDFYAQTETRTFRYLNGSTYQRNYTKPYLWSTGYNFYFSQVDHFSRFDPQHTYVITDGQCYSACGVMTKLVQDTHAARLLGYSFNPFYTDPDGLALYNPGSCPGLMMDSRTITDIVDDWYYHDFFNDFVNFPPPLPRAEEKVSWTFSVAYSFNPSTRNQLLYFKNNSVDDVIPIFATPSDGGPDNLLEIARYVHDAYIRPQHCFDWEVQVDTARCTGHPRGQLWGHPCENGKFDLSKCAFSRCELGYFVSAASECSPLPPWQLGGPMGR